MAPESSWGHAIRLQEPDQSGGGCVMGSLGKGGCDRPSVYEVRWTRLHPATGESCTMRLPSCVVHIARFAQKHGLDVPEPPPRPLHVVIRRRDDEQQERDLTAHLLREIRALRREHAELAERFAGMFGLSSPSQRSLPIGEDPHDHRQRLWGDVRGSRAG